MATAAREWVLRGVLRGQSPTPTHTDDSVRAVALTASGRFFCAGGDVKAMAGYGDHVAMRVKRLRDDAHRAVSAFARMRLPLVVAVNGITAGGGFGIAMAGDLVLAAESASFTTAYTNKISWERMFENIRTIGPSSTILSTDLGQSNNPFVDEGLAIFVQKLLDADFTESEIQQMAGHNAAQVLEG